MNTEMLQKKCPARRGPLPRRTLPVLSGPRNAWLGSAGSQDRIYLKALRDMEMAAWNRNVPRPPEISLPTEPSDRAVKPPAAEEPENQRELSGIKLLLAFGLLLLAHAIWSAVY